MDEIKQKRMAMHFEGVEPFGYICPAGYLTIGIGRNIDPRSGRGLLPDEIDLIYKNDLNLAVAEATKHFPWFSGLSDVRQAVILDMIHNMGLPRFCAFTKTISYLRQKAYREAAEEMLNSKWATQCRDRAVALSKMMESDEWPSFVLLT